MKNLFAFHGVDHKCGTTMLAQSVAELLAEAHKGKNILLVSLNGRKSAEYVCEDIAPIDKFKSQLDSGLEITKKLLSKNRYRDNLYFISGIENELEERYYLPETADKLLQGLAGEFDVIVADTGSEIDNGLAIGGLVPAKQKYLVMTQNEAVLKRYEKNWMLYETLKIFFDFHIVNKYEAEDPYGLAYISKRLGIDRQQLMKVEMAGYGRQAEMDGKTLLGYRQDKYLEDVLKIAGAISNECELGDIKLQRKNKWKKSFI